MLWRKLKTWPGGKHPQSSDIMSTPDPVKANTLAGVNVMLMGPAGTGKTHSLGTAVAARPDFEFFYLGLEPGLESLLGYFKDKGKPIPPNLHWHTVAPSTASFTEMIDAATKISQFTMESLAKMSDTNKSKHNQFILLLQALNNFKCERDGKEYGPVNGWNNKRVLMIDGLTGLCRCAMSLVVGGKAVKSQADWGIAQDTAEKLIRMLCDACACHFILLAHVERETDMVLGGVKLMPSALGKAMAPKLPSMFSDVILTVREGTTWKWDTASALADVKTRNLPIKADNAPDFKPIFDKWQSRGEAV